MTCIVGVQHGGLVFLGGDSASVADDSITVSRSAKVFHRDDYVIGFAGSWRAGQIVEHDAKLPAAPRNRRTLQAFMVSQFAPAIREALDARKALKDDGDSPAPLLVGCRGQLFHIDIDFQVATSRDGYMAIGTGGDLALGVLRYLRDETWTHPAYRIRSALKAAEHHCTSVRRPFKVVSG